MTDPFAMRSLCAFKTLRQGPNYHFNNSTDDNTPSLNQYPGLAFPNKDNVNYFVPSSETEYTIHKTLENPHQQKVEVEDEQKIITASASPKEALQKGKGQMQNSVLKAFEHPVMKTSKITISTKGSGKVAKDEKVKKVKKTSKIRYV